ncbi:hypothetical protein GCM10011318_09870 [Phaeocystidibacter marisrubri]|nr:hypothetical protein GCM10011318_09870 [Phaeocystidibacter marisrubri]
MTISGEQITVYSMPHDTLTIREGTLEVLGDSASLSIQAPSYTSHFFRFELSNTVDSLRLSDSIQSDLKIEIDNESMTWKGYDLFGQRSGLFTIPFTSCLDEIRWTRHQTKSPVTLESFVNRREAKLPTDTLLDDGIHLVIGHVGDSIRLLSSHELTDSATSKNRNPNLDFLRAQDGYYFYADYRNGAPTWQLRLHKIPFINYPSERYDGQLAAPDFKSYPGALRFKSQILEECEKGINFSGKYTLAKWGCGSACQMGVVVNRETGAISDFITSELGMEFRANSSLLRRNIGALDTLTNLMDECSYCTVEQLNWTGSSFDTLQFNFEDRSKGATQVVVEEPTLIAISASGRDIENLKTFYGVESFYIVADDEVYDNYLLLKKADSLSIETMTATGPKITFKAPLGELMYQSPLIPNLYNYVYWNGQSFLQGDLFDVEEWVFE